MPTHQTVIRGPLPHVAETKDTPQEHRDMLAVFHLPVTWVVVICLLRHTRILLHARVWTIADRTTTDVTETDHTLHTGERCLEITTTTNSHLIVTQTTRMRTCHDPTTADQVETSETAATAQVQYASVSLSKMTGVVINMTTMTMGIRMTIGRETSTS